MAPPTIMAEREATAPKPGTSRAESPAADVTASGAMPSRRAATLAEHGLMPLPAGAGADADIDRLAAGKRDARGLFRKRAGDLQIAADADAAQLAGLLRRLPARGKAGVVGKRQRALEGAPENRRCRRCCRRRWCREFCRAGSGCAGAIRRRRCRSARRRHRSALHQIARLRTAGAAIGPGRQRVGEHAARVHLRVRDVVDRRQAAGDMRGDDEMRDAGEIGADIAEAVDAQAEKAAALVERKLRAPERVAALIVGDEGLRAGRDPMDRLLQQRARRAASARIPDSTSPSCRRRRRDRR